jgi:hypothetical protein
MRLIVTKKADDKDASAIRSDGKEGAEEKTPGKTPASGCQHVRRR